MIKSSFGEPAGLVFLVFITGLNGLVFQVLDRHRVVCLKTVVVVALAWGLVCTRRVWRSPRFCPRVPLLASLPELAAESVLFNLLLVLLAAIAVMEQPGLPIAAF